MQRQGLKIRLRMEKKREAWKEKKELFLLISWRSINSCVHTISCNLRKSQNQVSDYSHFISFIFLHSKKKFVGKKMNSRYNSKRKMSEKGHTPSTN